MRDSSTVAIAQDDRRSRLVCVGSGALAVLLLIVAQFVQSEGHVGLFFVTGASLLLALLTATRWAAGRRTGDLARGSGMVIAQVIRFPGRTMASLTLIAVAVFVLVAVGLNRHEGPSAEVPGGAGGFGWVGETVIPILGDLNKQEDLMDFGFSASERSEMERWDVHRFRLRPGEDVSCLNLHRPGQPRILGVEERTIERGGFTFHSHLDGVDAANPWRGLDLDLGEDIIPAIGDFNSIQWILHSGLGQDVVIQDELGRQVRLRFVALLKGSVLQSEVLISEKHFLRHFPSIAGHRFFAIDSGDESDELEGVLESKLDTYGMDVMTTAFRLARYQAVENTYMATFQMIGGLGAVLGTLGIGVLMLRNAAERRAELAGMRAIGFSKARLRMLLFQENALLILSGVGIGALAGVVAVAPNFFQHAGSIPWMDLVIPLGAVCVTGIVSGYVTATAALRAPIVQTLKTEA